MPGKPGLHRAAAPGGAHSDKHDGFFHWHTGNALVQEEVLPLTIFAIFFLTLVFTVIL